MGLVHLASTLVNESTDQKVDIRLDVKEFAYEYAMKYAMRALRDMNKESYDRTDIYKECAVEDMSERSRGKGEHTERAIDYADSCIGTLVWNEQLDTNARDIVQNAFIRYWKARKTSSPMNTQACVRYAVKQYRREERKAHKPGNIRCGDCRKEEKPCDICNRRMIKYEQAWMDSNRPTALTKDTRETLAEVSDKPDADMSIVDVSIPENGSATRQDMSRILRWLATGSSQAEIAQCLHMSDKDISKLVKSEHNVKSTKPAKHGSVSEGYVRKLLSKLRDMFTDADFKGPVVGLPMLSACSINDRTYGQGKGYDSQWIGYHADICDRMWGHTAADEMRTVPNVENLRRKMVKAKSGRWAEVFVYVSYADTYNYPPQGAFIGPMPYEPTCQPVDATYARLPVIDPLFGPEVYHSICHIWDTCEHVDMWCLPEGVTYLHNCK